MCIKPLLRTAVAAPSGCSSGHGLRWLLHFRRLERHLHLPRVCHLLSVALHLLRVVLLWLLVLLLLPLLLIVCNQHVCSSTVIR
jgi:hypothetical protein